MQYYLILPLLLLFTFFSQTAECGKNKQNAMNQMLEIKVTCKDNPKCLFSGDDLFILITITNRASSPIGFPLDFVKDRGPIVELTDAKTGSVTNLPTHPADGELLDEFVILQPGGSTDMEWVIKPDELEQFGNEKVDVTAQISIMATISVDGQKTEFIGSDTIRIIGKDKED